MKTPHLKIRAYVGSFTIHRRDDAGNVHATTIRVRQMPPGWKREMMETLPPPLPPEHETEMRKNPETGEFERVLIQDDPR
jgi:hypothetical protein